MVTLGLSPIMDLHIVRQCHIFQAHGLGSLPVGLGMPRDTESVASISNKEAELEKLAEPELEEPAAVSKEQAKHAALAKIKASKRARLQRARA
jgi:hypothetical protein